MRNQLILVIGVLLSSCVPGEAQKLATQGFLVQAHSEPTTMLVRASLTHFPPKVAAKEPSEFAQDQELPPLIRSVEGPELFRSYCASCHGLDAKGDGPAAVALKVMPANLTVLAKNNGGQFPSVRVRRTITGEDVLASHGSREMPIWGPIFHQIEADVDRGYVRLNNLVKYLESIQVVTADGGRQKPASQTPMTPSVGPTGAELFKQHCAVCHLSDSLAGSVPPPFRVPPDLTTLARRYGGKFPEAYVTEVLHNGVKMPAHGPSEMPIWGADFVARDKLDEKQVTLRITQLTDYLKSIQTK
jgi:mono/diheme cytochrome c family protein